MHGAHELETPPEAHPGLLPDGLWVVDREASAVSFSVRHLAVATVRGRFTDFEGWVEAGPAGGRAGGRVAVESIDTGIDVRDERLRSPGCFDAERHPWMTFEGDVIELMPHFAVAGELTIADRTRPLVLAGAVTALTADRVAADLRGTVRRREFGLEWSALLDKGLPVVADAVAIRLQLTLRRRP